MSIRDAILTKRAQLAAHEITRPITKAELIEVDGSVKVSDMPGYVWAREYGLAGGVFQVFNAAVTAWAGLPVLVANEPKHPHRRRVIGVDWETLAQNSAYTGDPYLPGHHLMHERYDGAWGADPVDIYLRMLFPLRCELASGVIVRVAPLVYYVAGARQYYLGTTALDLAAYVPTVAGKSRRVLVYLDTITNIAKVSAGTLGTGTGLSYPAVPAGAIPSAYVTLAYGDTLLSEKTDFLDARPLFAAASASGTSVSTANTLPTCGA